MHPVLKGLKVVSVGKVPNLEVMGTNVVTNEVDRHFSKLTEKRCWELANCVLRAKQALEGNY